MPVIGKLWAVQNFLLGRAKLIVVYVRVTVLRRLREIKHRLFNNYRTLIG